jgi:Tol biopolymer transport system component
MKTARTRGLKSLVSVSLIFVLFAGGMWSLRKTQPEALHLPKSHIVTSLTFSPDGKRVIAFYDSLANKKSVGRVFDMETRTELSTLEKPSTVWVDDTLSIFSRPAWSPDSRQIVLGYREFTKSAFNVIDPYHETDYSGSNQNNSYQESVKFGVWNAETGKIESDWKYAPVSQSPQGESVRFSTDGKRFIGEGSPPILFDGKTGKHLNIVRSNFRTPITGTFSPDLNLVAVRPLRRDGLQLIEVASRKVLWQPKIGPISNIIWRNNVMGAIETKTEKDGQYSGNSRVLLWDGATRKPLPPISLPNSNFLSSLKFSPDNRRLAFFHHKPPSIRDFNNLTTMVVWDYKKNRELWRYPVRSYMNGCEWSPDGQWLSTVVSGDNDEPNRLKIFDRNGKIHKVQEFYGINRAWSPDSKSIIYVSQKTNTLESVEINPAAENS